MPGEPSDLCIRHLVPDAVGPNDEDTIWPEWDANYDFRITENANGVRFHVPEGTGHVEARAVQAAHEDAAPRCPKSARREVADLAAAREDAALCLSVYDVIVGGKLGSQIMRNNELRITDESHCNRFLRQVYNRAGRRAAAKSREPLALQGRVGHSEELRKPRADVGPIDRYQARGPLLEELAGAGGGVVTKHAVAIEDRHQRSIVVKRNHQEVILVRQVRVGLLATAHGLHADLDPPRGR